MLRKAFIDDQLAARQFNTGETVRKSGLRGLLLSPYAGRVLYSNVNTGIVEVQWPWGAELEFASELVHDVSFTTRPPSTDQSYSTLEGARNINDSGTVESDQEWRSSLASRTAGHEPGDQVQVQRSSGEWQYAEVVEARTDVKPAIYKVKWQERGVNGKWVGKIVDEGQIRPAPSLASQIVSGYEDRTLPVYRAACKAMHDGLDEVTAFVAISKGMAEEFGTDTVRRTVANLYEAARRMAIYWVDPKRQYRVTQKEQNGGVLACPRCKGTLKPRTYRQGKRVLLCKGCGFTISPKDVKK